MHLFWSYGLYGLYNSIMHLKTSAKGHKSPPPASWNRSLHVLPFCLIIHNPSDESFHAAPYILRLPQMKSCHRVLLYILYVFSFFQGCRVRSLPSQLSLHAPCLSPRKRFLHVCLNLRAWAFLDLHSVIPGPLLTHCWSLICYLSSSYFPTLSSSSMMSRLLNPTRPNPLILLFRSCLPDWSSDR